jgi:uncharacterized membrane protein YdcZ (DUF606 family)
VATLVVPRIGAVPLALGVPAGQDGISLVLDQPGRLVFKQHAITPLRVLGVVLLASGVTLVRLF